MAYKVIYDAPPVPKPHVCDLPDVMTYEIDTIIECDCSQQWALVRIAADPGKEWFKYSGPPNL